MRKYAQRQVAGLPAAQRSQLTEDDLRAASEWARIANKTVFRIAMLPCFYLLCWTPALVMLFLRVGSVRAAEEPSLDITVAIITSLASSLTQILNLALFPPLRHALAAELSWCHDFGSGRIGRGESRRPESCGLEDEEQDGAHNAALARVNAILHRSSHRVASFGFLFFGLSSRFSRASGKVRPSWTRASVGRAVQPFSTDQLGMVVAQQS